MIALCVCVCSIDKLKKKSIKNWSTEHNVHIKGFMYEINKIEERMKNGTAPPTRPFDSVAFNRYLVWFCGVARTQLNPPAFDSKDILLEPNPGFYELANLEYNKLIRNGRRTQLAPIVRFVLCYHFTSTFFHNWNSICTFQFRFSAF